MLYITEGDSTKEANWFAWARSPIKPKTDVVTFQASGDELVIILEALNKLATKRQK